MADKILVVVEQREGKLNRVSWETVAAGQALAAETGWTLEAAVVGGRQIDNLPIAGNRHLIVRSTDGHRPDIHRAPVSSVRNRPAEERPEHAHGVEALMGKYRAMYGVPAPPARVAAKARRQVGKSPFERHGHDPIARLQLARIHIVTPRIRALAQRA